MVAAFRLAERLGAGDAEQSARMAELLRRLGLPIDVDRYLDERTLAFIGSDKKRKGGQGAFHRAWAARQHPADLTFDRRNQPPG